MEYYRQFHILLICVVLPACFHTAKKRIRKKESSQSSQGEGSIFVPVSEKMVRDDVREHHKMQAGDLAELVQKKSVSKLSRRLTRKEREELVWERAREQQAKLVDIPVPMNVEPIGDFFDNEALEFSQGFSLGYLIEMSSDDIMNFYRQELERHGWRMVYDVGGPELLANFVKPGKFCSVSVRPSFDRARGRKRSAEIVIFTGPATEYI